MPYIESNPRGYTQNHCEITEQTACALPLNLAASGCSKIAGSDSSWKREETLYWASVMQPLSRHASGVKDTSLPYDPIPRLGS